MASRAEQRRNDIARWRRMTMTDEELLARAKAADEKRRREDEAADARLRVETDEKES